MSDSDSNNGKSGGSGDKRPKNRDLNRARNRAMRSASRLGGVQALYQMDIARTDLTEVIADFTEHRLAEPLEIEAEDGEPGSIGERAPADVQFFADLVRGVVRRQRELDPLIDEQLAEGWRLARIDSILRAVLRCAAFELVERVEVPARVIIDEYLEIAHAFFSGEEPKVVNGVLDKLARKLRSVEFGVPSSQT